MLLPQFEERVQKVHSSGQETSCYFIILSCNLKYITFYGCLDDLQSCQELISCYHRMKHAQRRDGVYLSLFSPKLPTTTLTRHYKAKVEEWNHPGLDCFVPPLVNHWKLSSDHRTFVWRDQEVKRPAYLLIHPFTDTRASGSSWNSFGCFCSGLKPWVRNVNFERSTCWRRSCEVIESPSTLSLSYFLSSLFMKAG